VDFVGHIGGDDFVLLLRSQDWSLRLTSLLEELAVSLPNFHSEQHRAAAGYAALDREGAEKTFPLLSVSIAALEVTGSSGLSQPVTVDAVMEGLLKTKSAAKARPGNVCLLATPSGLFDLAVTHRSTQPAEESFRLKAVGCYSHS
jgi:GGDEF domain-containing protein